MESLALFAALLLGALLLSSLTALLVTWRARSKRAHLLATVLALPGLLVALQLLVAVRSTGAQIFGLIGLVGFGLPLYRTYRFIAGGRKPD